MARRAVLPQRAIFGGCVCVDGVSIRTCPGSGDRRSASRRRDMVGGMSIAKDDIQADWELSDTIVVKMEGDDGDGTDGTDGGDDDGDGTDGTDGDGTDGDGSDS